jgi:hypothetical protein
VKFSDLLGEPEPEERPADASAERSGEPDAITVFAPVPEASPDPPPPLVDRAPDPVLDAPQDPPLAAVVPTGRSDLASLNVHQPAPAPEPPRSSVLDQLVGLDEVVDDLLPPRRGRK